MKIAAFTLTGLLAAVPSFAQGHLGVKGGIGIANQYTDGGPSLDARVGVVAGAFYTLPIVSWLDVQAEGLYTMKGSQLTFQGIASTLALDYFEIPVLARVRFGSGRTRFYVAGGLSPAFRVRAKARTAFSGSTEEFDVSDQIERVDVGVTAGGGAEIGRLIVDARYTHGLSDIDANERAKTTNRAIALTGGFRF